MIADTIDQVIDHLAGIIDWSRQEWSRLGYFAALYRKVTITVKQGIASGFFENGPRMERLDVIFANRYLEALEQYRNGKRPSLSWLAAFDAARDWRPIILQQLLLGMNAHINFDLGVAAAEVSPGDELPSLKTDFDRINQILSSLIDQVEDEINEVSPWLAVLDHIGGRTDEMIVNFSIDAARDHAWAVAQKLAPLPPDQWGPVLTKLDRDVEELGRIIKHPGLLSVGLLIIRLRESNNIPKVIDVLAGDG
jgi:hypothetical protein